LLLHSHTQSAQSLPVVSEFLAVKRFLSPGCTSWVPGACSCIHTHNQRNLYRWDLNSWRLPDAPFYRAAHRGCRSLAPVFTHRISASLPLGSDSWWSDASCRWAAHRGCRALAPAFTHRNSVFTHRISAISTVGIRIPGGQTLPADRLHIVGKAGRLLLHSHTESAQSLPLASEFLAARRFLPLGCTSWVPGACSCIHTQNQRNICRWHPNSWWPDASCQQHPATSWRPDASCRRTAHRGCCALAPAFTHTISALFTIGIRIPGGQTLPVAGLPIVGAVRLLLHSHTESAQFLLVASEFLAARRFLPPG